MARRRTYTVRLSPYRTIKTTSTSHYGAKLRVWNYTKDGFTYGYKNKKDFMKNVTVE